MATVKKIGKKACVIGGSGFMASCLVKQLLHKGYAVNTTVRDPGSSLSVKCVILKLFLDFVHKKLFNYLEGNTRITIYNVWLEEQKRMIFLFCNDTSLIFIYGTRCTYKRVKWWTLFFILNFFFFYPFGLLGIV